MLSYDDLLTKRDHIQIAHQIAGRVRLKYTDNAPRHPSTKPPKATPSEKSSLARIQQHAKEAENCLAQIPGILSVSINTLARSCTIHYDSRTIPDAAWLDFLQNKKTLPARTLQDILHKAYDAHMRGA